MEERYVNIPYKVLKRKDLTHISKMVYGFVCGFWDGECQASNDYIGSVFGCDGRTIQRAVKLLREKGLVRAKIVINDSNQIVGRILTKRK